MKANRKLTLILIFGACGLLFLGCWVWIMADYVVHFQRGYRYFGANDGMTIIDRFDLSRDEINRVFKRYDDLDRQGKIPNGDDDFGMPKVGPNVDRYRVYQWIITGHVSKLQGVEGDENYYLPAEKKLKKPGYFIIDMHTDRAYRGLGKQEWRNRLRKYGVDHEPKLFKPSRFDAYNGHNKPKPLSD